MESILRRKRRKEESGKGLAGKKRTHGGTSYQERIIGVDMIKGQEVCTYETHQVVS